MLKTNLGRFIAAVLVVVLIFLTALVFAQTCDEPYDLGDYGEWSDCWEAPIPFESFDTCFDPFPDVDGCPAQCGGAYLLFEVGSLGIGTFYINGDLSYTFATSDLTVHFYVLDESKEPVFYSSTCGLESLGLPIEVLNGDGVVPPNYLDDEYTITLSLPPGFYYMVIGNIGTGQTQPTNPHGVQDSIEGCLTVTYFTQGVLSLYIPELPPNALFKKVPLYGQLGGDFLYIYNDGTKEIR